MPSPVEQSKKARQAFQQANHECPVCGELGLLPLGGPGSYWIEHSCGAYSEMKPTLEEALNSKWVNVDPELNARMYPPVGG
jgi:hypothetical protein